MAANPLEASIQSLVDVLRSLPGGIRNALRGQGYRPPAGGAAATQQGQQATAVGFGQGTAAFGVGVLGQLFPPIRRLSHEFGALADTMRTVRESAAAGRVLASASPGSPLSAAQRQSLLGVAQSPLLSAQERQQITVSIQRMDQAERRATVAQQAFQVAQRQARTTVTRVRQQVTRAARERDTTIGRVRQRVTQATRARDTALGRVHQAGRREQRAQARYRRAQTQFRTNLAAFQQVAAQHAANPQQFAAQFITAQQTLAASQRAVDRTRGGYRSARSGVRAAAQRLQTAQANLTRSRGVGAVAIRAARTRFAAVAGRGQAAIRASVARVAQRFGVAQTASAAATTARGAALTAGGNAAALLGGRAVAGAFGIAATAIIELGRAAAQSTLQLRYHAEAVNQGNRALAGFSGKISVAFAQLDVHQIFRDMRRVRETEDTSKNLVRSIDQMRSNFLQFDVALQNIQNRLAAAGGAFAGGVGKGIGRILGGVDQGAGALGLGGDKAEKFFGFLGEAAGGFLEQIATSMAAVTGFGAVLNLIAAKMPDKKDPREEDSLPVAQWMQAMAFGQGMDLRLNNALPVGPPIAPQAPRPQNLMPNRPFPFGVPGAGRFGGGGPNAG